MTSKTELKSYFENGDIPNQEQFWAWMDSYWHKEEAIEPNAVQYTNTQPTVYKVGGVPTGITFENMPIKQVLDYIFYGKVDLSSTEIKFKIRTTQANERVPVAMLRTAAEVAQAKVNYGDGKEEMVVVPTYNGSESWTDGDGNTHYIDTGNTFYHVYETAGDYEITINAEANVSYARFCEGLTKNSQGYFEPTTNNYIVELSKFKSNSLTNLDYTFAGLSQANVSIDFKLETPEVSTMNSTFYGFGEGREFEAFPADMLSQITKPTGLRGTFFRAGLKKILPGFLDSFFNLETVWECFKNSKLGSGHYQGLDAGTYISQAVEGTNDFIPVSLFWKNPKLKDISHCFNYIGGGWFGNLTSGYLAYFVIRRELFQNGKSLGNVSGTIENAFYAFAKCNRILFEPNILKHAPNMVHMGGMFTQTNYMSHAVSWGGMIPVGASEDEVFTFYESDGDIEETKKGKGLTFQLSVMFPNISYPKILTLNGAFSTAAIGSSMGFRDNLDYTPNGSMVKWDTKISGKWILDKFPNAKAGSVDSYAKLILGQSGGSEADKSDGRNGAFYMLDQDDRILDKSSLPTLVFNNAIPY
ncbi:hypothetical protein HZQ75_15510 [Elizabethkingia anophelis]|uniref:PKD domain-containing protein n=1 Tax=Elizabethkingia anophelis R26 TaxID=1246994 RepID=A0ABN5BR28_9FLAO|nr:hypothetical protein [Elizabethkingia anophelis]ATC36304.1 hypothetical protein BAZ09_008780 [Elizabethkingia anophelis R26]ATC39981.1 hypothetical protein EAAG1_008995 [Elizabethkingia anophelis Ag1]ATC43659.1 hypothetical protein CMV41_08995 [Elizabethkingia anophelis]ATC47335.1 hypothetical protein CMV40_08995 [Elizabethkingia anophelis]ELR80205.1 hypothetical protein D505_05799 [Elizabethkingia anophelis R26]